MLLQDSFYYCVKDSGIKRQQILILPKNKVRFQQFPSHLMIV